MSSNVLEIFSNGFAALRSRLRFGERERVPCRDFIFACLVSCSRNSCDVQWNQTGRNEQKESCRCVVDRVFSSHFVVSGNCSVATVPGQIPYRTRHSSTIISPMCQRLRQNGFEPSLAHRNVMFAARYCTVHTLLCKYSSTPE